MNVNTRIIKARKEKGYTQEELAELAKVTVRTIQRIESSKNAPRSYTLKAIAHALGLTYEELTACEEKQAPVAATPSSENNIHFLKLFNLSCFSYLLIPFVHFLVPVWLLKKQTSLDNNSTNIAKKMIRQQIWWVAGLHLLMLATLFYNYIQVSVTGNRQYYVNYLAPFLFMYLLNAGIIIYHQFRIQWRIKNADYQSMSCI